MKDELPKSIANIVIAALADVRKAKGISHDKIAAVTGLHRSTIGLIESRKREPTLLTLLRISKALGCSLGQIILQAEKDAKKH